MKPFLTGLLRFAGALLEVLKSLPKVFSRLLPFLCALCRAIHRCFRRPERNTCCPRIPPGTHVRADPMLYSQPWLMSQGLAVTWDNPDIQLYDMLGNPVASSDLKPSTDYKVVVRIWNNSYDAPAAGLGVYLSYLHIGFGNTKFPIANTGVNLGVKGSAHCPVFAALVWHTPSVPGHYCLQAELAWTDDANPNNNLGQENTLVGAAHSPALFQFTATNDVNVAQRFELEADMYTIPPLRRCSDEEPPRMRDNGSRPSSRYEESLQRWAATLKKQAYGMFPVTNAWRVNIEPRNFELAPGASQEVSVTIEPVSGTFSGSQAFNIHGFATPLNAGAELRRIAGGVTLYVQG
jgi:hypothetical protein